MWFYLGRFFENIEYVEVLMSGSTEYVAAPAGMSPVNAFRALWVSANTAVAISCRGSEELALSESTVDTAEKVQKLFRSSYAFSYIGSRGVKADFSEFPLIEISAFDEEHGKGAAEAALKAYSLTPSSERFDKNDATLRVLFRRFLVSEEL